MNHLSAVAESRALPFNPEARAYEAFSLDNDVRGYTKLYEPLQATSLKDALAEITARWNWDRGDRIGVRELGGRTDLLHIYAVRRSSHGIRKWNGHSESIEYARSLEHIATLDIDELAGTGHRCVGVEVDLHNRRQAQRPEGARLRR
jgi:hypothetical protein